MGTDAALAASVLQYYINSNPIRTGLLSDPKDYRWSGLRGLPEKKPSVPPSIAVLKP